MLSSPSLRRYFSNCFFTPPRLCPSINQPEKQQGRKHDSPIAVGETDRHNLMQAYDEEGNRKGQQNGINQFHNPPSSFTSKSPVTRLISKSDKSCLASMPSP